LKQSHQSDPRVLSRRTLEHDHPRLAGMLRPGMSVLDVGCGTGAITAGIAAAVGPSGTVVGLDRDESLIAMARGGANLTFEVGDLLTLAAEPQFDMVTAARLIQWISEPGEAIHRMAAATKPGGRVVVLDYNHELNAWDPEPPLEFRRFYQAFLDWRTANGWDNMMGDHLPALFEAAGLRNVMITVDDQIGISEIWLHVIESLGPKILPDENDRLRTQTAYREYLGTRLRTQTLSLRTVTGTAH